MSRSLLLLYLMFVASTLLALWCFRHTREPAARERRRITAAVASATLPFLISFAAASGLYAILATVLYWLDQDSITIETVYKFETNVRSFREFVQMVKLGTWQSVGVLAGLWLLSLRAKFAVQSGRGSALGATVAGASSVFRRYSKTVSCCSVVLTLLASFTFFGPTLDPQLGNLQIRVKTADAEIVKIGAGIVRVLTKEVQHAVLHTVKQTSPDIAADLNRLREVHAQQTSLLRTHPQAVILDERTLERTKALHDALLRQVAPSPEAQSPMSPSAGTDQVRSTFRTSTGDELKGIDGLLQQLSDGKAEQVKKLVDDQEQNLTEKIVDGVVELGLTGVEIPFKDLMEEVPFAEPLLDVFQKAMSKVASEALEPGVISRVGRELLVLFRSGKAWQYTGALRAEAQRLVEQRGNAAEAWTDYSRVHTGKIEKERDKLRQWENAVEQARINVERVESETRRPEAYAGRDGKVDLSPKGRETSDPLIQNRNSSTGKQPSLAEVRAGNDSPGKSEIGSMRPPSLAEVHGPNDSPGTPGIRSIHPPEYPPFKGPKPEGPKRPPWVEGGPRFRGK